MNQKMLRQAQELQARLAKAQQELVSATVEGSAGGGAIKIVMNGHQEVQSVKISPEAVDPQDVSLLEDMILVAIKDASQKAQDLAQQRMGALTGGLKIPGLM